MAQKFRPSDMILVHVDYQYQGMPQGGEFIFGIGTGIKPSYFEKRQWPAVPFQVAGAMNWEPRQLDLEFQIPPTWAEPGTYTARGTLRMLEDVTQEIDTDWSALEIVA